MERASRKLARQTFYGMGRWQAGLEHHQAFLGRIVDIGAELFAMAASCTRAEMLRADGLPGADTARELADAFCSQSRLRCDDLFNHLWTNTDEDDDALAGRVLDGAFGWLEDGVLDPSEGTGPWISPSEPGPSTMPNVHRNYR